MTEEEKQEIWEAITTMRLTINDIFKEIKKSPSFEEDLEHSNHYEDHSIEWDR